MKQKDIIKFFSENGGLRCKDWNIKQIKTYIKYKFLSRAKNIAVYENTCRELKRLAEIYQR